MFRGWIGYDLDGSLATYTVWEGPESIGDPIPTSINRVKALLASGQTVKIFTARVCSKQPPDIKAKAEAAIKAWCKKHIGQELDVTAEKDWEMIEHYDDRAISIEYNTGKLLLQDIV